VEHFVVQRKEENINLGENKGNEGGKIRKKAKEIQDKA